MIIVKLYSGGSPVPEEFLCEDLPGNYEQQLKDSGWKKSSGGRWTKRGRFVRSCYIRIDQIFFNPWEQSFQKINEYVGLPVSR